MKSKKRTVKYIANKFKLDCDEVLVFLWDYSDRSKFDYLKKAESVVRQKDLAIVEKALCFKKNEKVNNDLNDKLLNFFNKKTGEKSENNSGKENLAELKSYDFSSIGKRVDNLLFLNKNDVLTIHSVLVEDFKNYNDPIYPSGVKDEKMLESAIFHPKTGYGDVVKYPTIESAGAAIFYSLCQNHCFHNGNKRTALVSMLVFLDRHNIALQCDENEFFKLALNLADHKLLTTDKIDSDAEIYNICGWICSHSKLMIKGEKVITFKRLYQILNRFECTVKDGKVYRIVSKNFLGAKRNKTLKTTIPTVQLGHEVDIEKIKKIREDLELDCVHNIDSDAFYYDAEYYACEFVGKYKNLLRRLSKF